MFGGVIADWKHACWRLWTTSLDLLRLRSKRLSCTAVALQPHPLDMGPHYTPPLAIEPFGDVQPPKTINLLSNFTDTLDSDHFQGSRPFWVLFISLTETIDAACLSWGRLCVRG